MNRRRRLSDIQFLRSATRLDPARGFAFVCRGVAYEYVGRRDEALADYARAIRLDPVLKDAYVARAIRPDQPTRVDDFTRALAIDPSDILVLKKRAYAQNDQNNTHAAIADWLKVAEMDPTLDEATSLLGVLYYNLCDKANADRYNALTNQLREANRRR